MTSNDMTTTLLNIHHGLMAASAVLQAINWVVGHLLWLWLAWQIVFCSGLRWRWFHPPRHLDRPVIGLRVSLSFYPCAGRWRRLRLLPWRDPYEWACSWLWFRLRWEWITQSRRSLN